MACAGDRAAVERRRRRGMRMVSDRRGRADRVRVRSAVRGRRAGQPSPDAAHGSRRPTAHPRPCRRRALLVAARGRRLPAGRGPISDRAGDRDRRRRRCRAVRQLRPRARGAIANCFTRGSTASASVGPAAGRWTANGRSEWIDAANAERPAPVASGLMAAGRRPHHFLFRLSLSPDPALHALPRRARYRRRAGAARSSPPPTARSSRPAGPAATAGRSQIAHGGGMVSLYGHMSEIVAAARQLRPRGPGDRLCRLFRSLDRPAPAFRGPARRPAGQSALACASAACQVADTTLPSGQGAAEGAAQR